MFHLAAYYRNFNPGGILSPLVAVVDQAITTNGNDVRVPTVAPNLIGEMALINDASGSLAEFQSPSLRAMVYLDVEPLILSNKFGALPESFIHDTSPVKLVPNESLDFYAKSAPAGAVDHYGLAWLSDGPLQAVTGPIYSLTATAAAALAAGAWVPSNLTFTQTLPAGDYQIVGMRARGANLVAARLAFVGGTLRPGVPAVNTIAQTDTLDFRYGAAGIFGQFNNTTPPIVECLGITDVSQSFIFDLIKVGGGV